MERGEYRKLLGLLRSKRLPGHKKTLFDYAEVVLLAPCFPNYLGQPEKILGWAGVCASEFVCIFVCVRECAYLCVCDCECLCIFVCVGCACVCVCACAWMHEIEWVNEFVGLCVYLCA